MRYFNNGPIFPIGEILISPAVIKLGIDLTPFLRRHQECDWSHLSAEDVELNSQALANGEAILVQYHVTTHLRESAIITIMTEEDRSYTVICIDGEPAMLPAG